MTDQLVFLDSPKAWRLDAATRERGLRGVADARAVLKEVHARQRVELQADPLPEAA